MDLECFPLSNLRWETDHFPCLSNWEFSKSMWRNYLNIICILDLTSETWNRKTEVRLMRDALSKFWITGLLGRLIISIHFKIHKRQSMAFACFTTRDSHVMYDSRKYSTWVGCVLIAHVAVAVDVGREHAPVCIKVLFTAARVLEKKFRNN